MKLLTCRVNGKEIVAILSSCQRYVYPIGVFGLEYQTMNRLIKEITEEEKVSLRNGLKTVSTENGIPYNRIEVMAPIPIPDQDMICLGINYLEHAKEAAIFQKEAFDNYPAYAVYFSKRINEAVADGGFIDGHFDIADSLDYEVELAFIIGKDAKNVSSKDAQDYVFGYTIINDVSARSIQMNHSQWYFGKSLDGFTPMGPWIVTADEVAFPPILEITSRVNGELRQCSTTDLLIFGISHIVSELSAGMTLKAGTIIATGTPSGVGMGFAVPKYLKSGDKVECSIEQIGKITNTVK